MIKLLGKKSRNSFVAKGSLIISRKLGVNTNCFKIFIFITRRFTLILRNVNELGILSRGKILSSFNGRKSGTQVGNNIVVAWLIRDDRLLISIRNSFFSGSPFGKNSKVKRAQLGVISGWATDQEVAPGCTQVRTKCTEKTSIDL